MKLPYKILTFILAGIVLVYISYIAIFYFTGRSYLLKKIDLQSLPSNYLASYFKENECQKLHIKYIARNKVDDTLIITNYSDSCEVALCIISNCNPNCFNDVFDTTQKKLVEMPHVLYNEGNFKDLYLEFKVSDLNLYNNTIHFFNCSNIDRLVHTKNIQYFHLKAGAIYFTSDNRTYEIGFGLNKSNYNDFLAISYNGKLLIFILYSQYHNVQIKPDELSNLVKFNLSYLSH